MLPKSEALRTFQYLPKVAEPRSQYLYNNHAYNIPGLIIERLSKQSYGTFLKENIFDPLGMVRTFTANPQDSNVAAAYSILSDGTPFRIQSSEASSDTLMFSAVSVRTSMADVLRSYGGILEELNVLVPGTNSNSAAVPDARRGEVGQAHLELSEPAQFPTKQLNVTCAPHIVRNSDTVFEQTSALGWMRTQLPGKLDFGWNAGNVSSMPLFGKGYPAKLALWHGGNMPGTTSDVILLPETRTAVVVFQNSLGLCDAADLIAQLLLDCLFLGKSQYDYVALAKEAVQNGMARLQKVAEQLEAERVPGTHHRPLEEYVGRYENAIKNWVVEIGLDVSNQLFLRFQSRRDEQYALRHYHHDVFVWNVSYDETVKRAQYRRPYEFYRFQFEVQDGHMRI
jgi:hypothetical protein